MEHVSIFYCIGSHCHVLFPDFPRKRRGFIYHFYPNLFCMNRLQEGEEKKKKKKGKNNITRAAEGGKWPLCVRKNRRNILNIHEWVALLCTLYTEHLYIHTPGHKPNLQLNKSFLAGFALYLICNTKLLHQTPLCPQQGAAKWRAMVCAGRQDYVVSHLMLPHWRCSWVLRHRGWPLAWAHIQDSKSRFAVGRGGGVEGLVCGLTEDSFPG